MKVLMVCTGNICRSPMAEAMLRDALARRGCDGIEVSSAGTWAGPGNPAMLEVSQALERRGIELGSHASQALGPDDLAEADLVVAMTSVHVREIADLDPDAGRKVILLKDIAQVELPDEGSPGSKELRLRALLSAPRPEWRRATDLDDPIGLPLAAYERCAAEIERAVDALVRVLCD